MQAQELSTIPAEQKAYELSVLWKEMSYNFGNIDNCPGLDIDSLYRAFLPKVTETKDDLRRSPRQGSCCTRRSYSPPYP